MCQSALNIKFAKDYYVKLFQFSDLNNDFNDYFLNLNEDNDQKYILCAIVGIIEGIIQVDFNNGTWSMIMLDKKFALYKNSTYSLLSLCECLKSNEKFFMFIKKYFNLWHKNINNKEFIYDSFHKNDLEENFNNLINIIEDDINNAYENNELFKIEFYNKIYNYLINSFCI